jgi:hypothetical protein
VRARCSNLSVFFCSFSCRCRSLFLFQLSRIMTSDFFLFWINSEPTVFKVYPSRRASVSRERHKAKTVLTSTNFMFPDIIHRPVYFSEHIISETGFCLRLQVKPETESSLRNVVFWKINRMVILDKDRTMDNVWKQNICTNVPTFRSYLHKSYYRR